MACENPLTAYRPAEGGKLSFSRTAPKDGRAYTTIQLPCQQCILCREEQARQWAVRIAQEATLHLHNSFVTFTLDEEHIPLDHSLNYKLHMQPMWKRLRKNLGPLRYYAVGEYGDKTQRPHYHACIFGHSFTEGRKIIRRQPTLLWSNEVLEKAWGLGQVAIGTLNYETARYTASYVTKKLRTKQTYVKVDEKTGELIALEQPRAYMSLNPAIARTWLEKWGNNVFTHDQVIINGKAQKPPKYYDRWLEKKSKIAHQIMKEERKKKHEKQSKNQNAHARAEIARARAKTKIKSI